MNKRDMKRRLKAGEDPLELSIEKYNDILDGSMALTRDHVHGDYCACCEKYSHNVGCDGCPVERKTKKDDCRGTPWKRLDEHLDDDHFCSDHTGDVKACSICKRLVTDERNFLMTCREPKEVQLMRDALQIDFEHGKVIDILTGNDMGITVEQLKKAVEWIQ